MEDKRYWDVIAVACPHDDGPDREVRWYDNLVEQLMTMPPELIVRFDHWFDCRVDAAYTRDLLNAADLVNYGTSDDGFYYFRCWLVGMGKAVYQAALADPDSLADVVDPARDDHEAEIYPAPRRAWERLGLAEEDFDRAYKALGRRRRPKLGDDWDVGDAEEVRRRWPRLAALYFESPGPDAAEGADDGDLE
jgi:hypothetical protein